MGRYVIRSPTPDLARSIARTPRIRDKRALSLAQDAMKDIAGCMIAGAKDEAAHAHVVEGFRLVAHDDAV